MSDITINNLEDNEDLAAGQFIIVHQPTAGGTRLDKKLDVTESNLMLSGVKLSVDRTAISELTSSEVLVSGWYTIAELADQDRSGALTIFNVASNGGSMFVKCGFRQSTITRTHENTDIEIIGKNFYTEGSPYTLIGARIAKSDSKQDSGAKFQVNFVAGGEITTNIMNNIGFAAPATSTPYPGWELVTPYFDDTPTLPDGVTVGTFLEAGEEYSLPDSGSDILAQAVKASDDLLNVTLNWGEIPMVGTTITASDITTLTVFGNSFATDLDGTYSLLNISIVGELVSFDVSKTSAWATLDVDSVYAIRTTGSGEYLTIS